MRRLALLALAALACRGQAANTEPGPLDRFFYPTGIGVLGGRVVVASSNADLTYASSSGGTVIAASFCDPAQRLAGSCTADTVAGALDTQSFSGKVAIADTAACPALAPPSGKGAAVLVPIRGLDFVYRLAADPSGALSCSGCEIGVGAAEHGDPFTVGVGCAPGLARGFVGYLRSKAGQTWLSQIDLLKQPGAAGYVLHRVFLDAGGQVRGIAFDASRKRVYFTRTATGSSTWLAYVDLANGCAFDVTTVLDGGCPSDRSAVADLPRGLELRGVGLANAPAANGKQRAYLTARIYDANASAASGGRVGDFDGLLLVVDLWEDVYGKLRISVVDQIPIGYGAGDLVVLPPRAGKRDVVAALAADEGNLWIYDDETGARVVLGRDTASGAPIVGHDPALAVDPALHAGNVARVYVTSFREHWVTPVDVPLDAPDQAAPVKYQDLSIRRIGPQLDQAVPQ